MKKNVYESTINKKHMSFFHAVHTDINIIYTHKLLFLNLYKTKLAKGQKKPAQQTFISIPNPFPAETVSLYIHSHKARVQVMESALFHSCVSLANSLSLSAALSAWANLLIGWENPHRGSYRLLQPPIMALCLREGGHSRGIT